MGKNKPDLNTFFVFFLNILYFCSLGFCQNCYYVGTYTPKTNIQVYFWNNICDGWEELDQDQKNFEAQFVPDHYGWCGASVIGEATITYNCHGYAWHVSEGGSPGWISGGSDTGKLQEHLKFMNDGSWVQEDNEEKAEKIYYPPSRSHSAIETLTPDVYFSKWDQRCLVRHPRTCQPYGQPSNVTYWSRYIRDISNKTYNNGTETKVASRSTLTAGNNVVVAAGAKVKYVSQGAMNLQSDFTVQNGAEFIAKVW